MHQRSHVAVPSAEQTTPWPLATPIGLYLLAFAAMTSPWLLGRVSIPWDSKAHFLPQIQFLAQSLWAGEWPWWNPYVFSGQPQIADPQSMIFSPPYLLLALLNASPGPWAQDVTLLAAMAAGGVGMIAWFRDKSWHWAGAIIAALVFTFGAAMAWRIQHTGQVLSLAYLPWAILFLDRAIERGSIAAGATAGLVSAFIVLGRDQVALLCVYLLVARTIWLWFASDHRRARVTGSLVPLVVGGVVGLVIVTLPVLMTVLLAADSNRPAIDFAGAGAGSLHPAQLVTFVIPQLFGAAGDMADYWGPPSFAWVGTGLFTAQNVGQCYVGAIPFLLIAGAAVTGRLWHADIRFFSVAFVVAVLYALGWYTPAFRAFYELPGVDLYRRPADAVFLIGGLGAILAGYATHTWFSEPWRRPGPVTCAAVSAVLLIGLISAFAFAVMIDRVPRLGWPLAVAAVSFLSAVCAMAWSAPRVALQPLAATLVLVTVTAADLGYNNGPSTSSALPPSTFDMLDPRGGNPVIEALKTRVVASATRRDRVELAGLGFHWPNASMTHRLENTLGYNPVRLGLYTRATGAEDHIGLPDQRKFSPLFPSYGSRLADMLGLRWIATGAPVETMDKALQPGELTLVAKIGSDFIYENSGTLPRVMFAQRAETADFAKILETGTWPEFDPTRTVLVEAPADMTGSASPTRFGEARIQSYGQTRIVIRVSSPEGGWVVLNDIWHPWWQATVDGASTEIKQANVLFRAVKVAPGEHTIVMAFHPLRGIIAELKSRLTRPVSQSR
ncbi:MAG: hypothetical protein AB7E81_18225 [Hyphomicrobiaceae bacterium]